MEDVLESADDERAVELSTIAAIFPELILDPSNPFSASLDLPVTPLKPFAVLFPALSGGAPLANFPTPPTSIESTDDTSIQRDALPAACDVRYLSHLPPLTLRIDLQDGYPFMKSPTIDIISSLSWLPESKLKELRDAGNTIWDELGRDQTLFAYIDYLQQAAEAGFDLVQSEGSPLELPRDLEIALLDYDQKARRAKFEQETFECGICLGKMDQLLHSGDTNCIQEPKKGSVCHRLLLCSHVFCVACLQDFYNNCITEGDVAQVKCLAPACGKGKHLPTMQNASRKRRHGRKDDRTLDPSELLQIPLEHEIVQRYVKLRRKKMLESDRNTVYCPREWCQGAAKSKKYPKHEDALQSTMSESEEDEDEGEPQADEPEIDGTEPPKLPPPNERLAICEDCSFAFCKVCKSGWHGEFAICFPRRQYELTAEERASEEYMKAHTTPCPTCDARCQKSMGCNHMICYKCETHFCYLCSTWLESSNPYAHFNTKWTGCYMKLWELEEGDGIDVAREAVPQRRAAPIPNAVVNVEAPPPAPMAPGPPPNLPPPRAQVNAPRANVGGNPNRVHMNARAQGAWQPGRMLDVRMQGLQRFLEMVEDDREDEWDSDELDDEQDHDGADGDRWEIPIR